MLQNELSLTQGAKMFVCVLFYSSLGFTTAINLVWFKLPRGPKQVRIRINNWCTLYKNTEDNLSPDPEQKDTHCLSFT